VIDPNPQDMLITIDQVREFDVTLWDIFLNSFDVLKDAIWVTGRNARCKENKCRKG